MTQKQMIMRHLKDFNTIDPILALEQYGIMRLASRISDLRKEGVPIKTKIHWYKNIYGEHKHYAIYSLK